MCHLKRLWLITAVIISPCVMAMDGLHVSNNDMRPIASPASLIIPGNNAIDKGFSALYHEFRSISIAGCDYASRSEDDARENGDAQSDVSDMNERYSDESENEDDKAAAPAERNPVAVHISPLSGLPLTPLFLMEFSVIK